jgi:hypothetical protein
MAIQYHDNMSPEDEKKLLAEIAAEDKARAEAAAFDAANAANGGDDDGAGEEASYYQELERGYAKDRI